MSEQLSQEMVSALNRPLPAEAIKPHPTKPYLSTIKPPFVIERLNEVFGVNGWYDSYEIIENNGPMVVAKVTLEAPQWGIKKFAFGGNNNEDRGDAYKGACTDALTKAASFLGIGLAVYKGEKQDGRVVSNADDLNLKVGRQAPPPVAKPVAAQNQQTSKPVQRPQFTETGTMDGDLLYCNPDVSVSEGQYGKYLNLDWKATVEGRTREMHAKHFPDRKNPNWAHIYNAINESHGKRSVFKTVKKGKYLNVVDVLSIEGRDYENGIPVIHVNEDLKQEINDDDIPF